MRERASMHRRTVVAVTMVILALTGTGVGAWLALRAPPGQSGPPERIVMAVVPGEKSAPVYVAEARGIFAANGLEVEVEEYESGVAAVKAVLAGKADVATAADYVFATASFDAPELRLLSSIDKTYSIWFVTDGESGIAATRDLAGRRVAVTPGSAAEYFLGASLAKNGMALEDVVVVPAAPGELEGALLSGSVDAVMVWEPYAYDIKQALGERAVSWSAQGNTFFYWTLMSAEGVLQARPQLSERLARSMLEAVSFINENPGEAERIVASRNGLDEPYMEYAWPLNRFEVSLDQALLLQLDRQALWFKESGLAGDSPIPNYLRRIDFTGLESADPGAVGIVH